jgi:hypothetical protein
VRTVRSEVKLVRDEVLGVPVRLMTMGRMSTVIHGKCCRVALAMGVYISRNICAVRERLWSMQYFHFPIWMLLSRSNVVGRSHVLRI